MTPVRIEGPFCGCGREGAEVCGLCHFTVQVGDLLAVSERVGVPVETIVKSAVHHGIDNVGKALSRALDDAVKASGNPTLPL